MIKNDVIWNGKVYHYTWYSVSEKTLTQEPKLVSGVSVTADNKVLIMHEYGKWRFPGGGPKPGESHEQTLRRELQEEVNILLSDVILVGFNEILGPDPVQDIQCHLWFACKISKLLDRTPDPEEGKIHEYKLVSWDEAIKELDWGPTGEALIDAAKQATCSLVPDRS